MDEDIKANIAERNEKFDNDSERLATQRTNAAAAEAGEAERPNHAGELIYAPDPTEHTQHWDDFDGSGASAGIDIVWVEHDSFLGDAFGDVFGDVFEMTDLTYGMPSIGGSPWGPFWPEETPNLVASADTGAVTAEPADAGVALIGVESHAMLHAELIYR